MLYGVKNVLGNLDKAERAGMGAAERGITKAALATVAYIKKELTGRMELEDQEEGSLSTKTKDKGFQSRTGFLRSSIRHDVKLENGMIIGYVIAGWGNGVGGKKSYAPYVEFRWNGKYSYLWRGVKEMKREIDRMIKKEMKGEI